MPGYRQRGTSVRPKAAWRSALRWPSTGIAIVIYRTLPEALDALSTSDRRITYLGSGDHRRAVRFADLRRRALGILGVLQDRGLKPGDQIIVLLNDNEQFIDVFWACLYGGVVPVPIAVGVSDEQRFKVFRIYQQLTDAYLYTERPIWRRLRPFADSRGIAEAYATIRGRCVFTDDIHDVSHSGGIAPLSGADIAFVQYSSGSTSTPKGVVLTHANLLANIRDIMAAARFTPDDVSLSWMPLTHDMGLIGFHLNMLISNMNHYLMNTEVFIRRPLQWLQAASRHRANILCSPNFGYHHLLKALERRKPDTTAIDLSAVRLIFNGAEPISAPLCEAFLTALAPYGLDPAAMFPVYGLAEASLAVAFPATGQVFVHREIDRGAVGLGDRARAPTAGHAGMRCVAVGRPIGACELEVADQTGKPLAEGTVGRILIRGPNVTQGYYRDPAATRSAIDARGWLDTGDLGFLDAGQLFITGRVKDVIFVNGQNYYAHDLEAVALESERIEPGKVVVGSHRAESESTDRVLVFVQHRGDVSGFAPTARDVARLINQHTGAEVSAVVPVPRVPKTTSGKVQRFALVQAYVDGEFDSTMAQLAACTDRRPEASQPPASAIEATLQGICDQVLGDLRLRRDDNFFETGASSLKLIEIHEQIERRYPGRVELTDLFDHPTLRELAAYMEGRGSTV